ncbi:hypothetical protein R6Z07M_005029 [Ovis aries]
MISVREAEAPAIGRSRRHGVEAGAEAGTGPAPARSPAGARGPPQLHRHDTDTQSLQLLSEPGALGTRRRGQPGSRTPALACPNPRRAPRGSPRLVRRTRRGSRAGSGQRRPAACGGCSDRPASSAGRSAKPARFVGGGGGRGRRALPEAAGPPASAPRTHSSAPRLRSGDLPGAPPPAPRPRPRAPGRGEALSSVSLPRSRGRAAQARGEGAPRPVAAPRRRALGARPGPTAAAPPPRGSLGVRSWGRGCARPAGLGAGRPCPEGAKRPRGAREVEPAPAAAPRLSPAPPPRSQPEADPDPIPCGAPPARKSPGGREQPQAAVPKGEEETVLSSGGQDPSRRLRRRGLPRSLRLAPPLGLRQRLLGPRPGTPAPRRRRRLRATRLFRGLPLPSGSRGQESIMREAEDATLGAETRRWD